MMTSERVTAIETRAGQRRSRNSDEKGQLQVSEAGESLESLAVGMGVGFGNRISLVQASSPAASFTLYAARERVSGNTNREAKDAAQATITPIDRVRCPEDDRD